MTQEPPSYQLLPFFRNYWVLTRLQHRRILGAALIILVMQGCAAIEPLALTTIMGHAARNGLGGWSQTLRECALLFALLLFLGWIQIGKSQRIREASVQIQHGLQLDLLRKLFQLNGSFFESQNVTALHSKMASGISKLGDMTFQLGHELIPLAVMAVATSVTVAWYSPIYTVVILPATAVYLVATVLVRASTAAMRHERHTLDRETDRLIGQALTHARTVWANCQEAREIEQVAAMQARSAELLRKEYKIYDRLDFWRSAWIGAARIICLLVCIYQAHGDHLRMFVDGMGVLILTERLFKVCYGIGGVYDRFTDASAPAQQALALRDQPVTITDPEDPVRLGTVRGEINLRNLRYAYDSAPNKLALNDVNLTIKAGETVGIVGESGGGKSTIMKALLHFIRLQGGQVLLDGVDIRLLRLHDLRGAIGYVAQETEIFDGTVAENIAYGKPGASIDEIVTAARQANAHEFILGLLNGYDTRVGDRGMRLSGGQRQRIGIARALLRGTQIIALDEATSNTDIESDISIHTSLRNLATLGKTVIVIAHRLATVQHADRIACVENGRIVEVGAPAELVRRNGTYARLLRAHEAFDRLVSSAGTLSN